MSEIGRGGGAGGEATGGGGGGGVVRSVGGWLSSRLVGRMAGGGGGGGDRVGGAGNIPSFSSLASRLFGSFIGSGVCGTPTEVSRGMKGERLECIRASNSAGGNRGVGLDRGCGFIGVWMVGLAESTDRGSLGCGCVDCVLARVGCEESLLFL